MAKFVFPKDNLTIIDATILSIDEDNIILNNKAKTLSVFVKLTDPSGSKMMPVNSFKDIPRDANTWDDCDLLKIVSNRLNQFKID